MASAPVTVARADYWSGLSDPARAIGSPGLDAVCFWGAPLICFCVASLWMTLAAGAEPIMGGTMAGALLTVSSVATFAHLVAVAPRAYGNAEVFTSNRRRLTLVPLLLLALLFFSPTALVIGNLVAVFWDVHHSAMQNFGLGRIYDMKAGNRPDALRTVDLRLNWVLYVGPLLAGSTLLIHMDSFKKLDGTALQALTALPGVAQQENQIIRWVGITAWTLTISWAALAYWRARRDGYLLPPHKAALILSTGGISVLAWGFASPLVAFVSINLYHATQYFALVWLKEGARVSTRLQRPGPIALLLFLAACTIAGIAYLVASRLGPHWIMAPFIACSLLHFWYDSFVWSVTKRQV